MTTHLNGQIGDSTHNNQASTDGDLGENIDLREERETKEDELLSSIIDCIIVLRTMAEEQGVTILNRRSASTSLYELLVDRSTNLPLVGHEASPRPTEG